jgi:hypothetical protein
VYKMDEGLLDRGYGRFISGHLAILGTEDLARLAGQGGKESSWLSPYPISSGINHQRNGRFAPDLFIL